MTDKTRLDIAHERRIAIVQYLTEHPGATAAELLPVSGFVKLPSLVQFLTRMTERREIITQLERRHRRDDQHGNVKCYSPGPQPIMTAYAAKENWVRAQAARWLETEPEAESAPSSSSLADPHYVHAAFSLPPNSGGQAMMHRPRMAAGLERE